MNAVAKHEEPQLPTAEIISTEAGTLMAVISRAASDPTVDVDKLERLMGLYERITGRQAEQAYDSAMSDAQGEMRPIATDSNNPQTKSKYASFAALDSALRPIYTKQGFGLSYDTDDSPLADHVRVVCRVSHKGGDKRTHHVDMPNDGKGAKGGDVMTKTHAQGAALTYGQRYLLKLIFNIAVGEDKDGNAPRQREDGGATVEAAKNEIGRCTNEADLLAWKAKNRSALDAMSSDDADEVVRAWNGQRKVIRTGAGQ